MFSSDVNDNEFYPVSDDEEGGDDLEGAGHQERSSMAKQLADNYADLRKFLI